MEFLVVLVFSKMFIVLDPEKCLISSFFYFVQGVEHYFFIQFDVLRKLRSSEGGNIDFRQEPFLPLLVDPIS